ncbi:GTPase-associated protein 1-related protein [Nocardiopsis sp. YSL2]|uniref:GTPase-associated protein 1-related protein n=1 Tax=Nocardiopsis sp. YSL2 TaxID=2939492 RepID=UPI0026F45585|nr:GTPase-associated protein 1-related protein [Nocardiopsis sp. YSL2]
MSTAEAHYTSVESGPTGAPGFQFVHASPGLRPALLRRIERHLSYEPPPAMPVRPAPAELADFPITLSHTRLTNDTTVLSHIVYVGRDHTGRYGNFYAHALVLPGAPGTAVLPIDTWGSSFWRTGAHDADTAPPAGAATTAGAGPADRPRTSPPGGRPRPDGAPSTQRLAAFTRRHRGRAAAVLTDILHALDGDADRQVVLVGSSTEAAHWIALACRSLPADLAGRLTFTTYTRRPDLSPHHVIGVTEDCAPALTDAASGGRYRVHRSGADGDPDVDHDADPDADPGAEPLTWAVAATALWEAGRGALVGETVAAGDQGAGVPVARRARDLGGALACAALAEGIELPAGAGPDAVAWCRDRVDERSRAWWASLLAALTARGPLRPEAARDLATALERRFGPDLTAPLVAAALGALPRLLVDEPDNADLREVLRWARTRFRAAGDDRVLRPARRALHEALARDDAPLHVLLELLRLSDVLVQPHLQEDHAARLLIPPLLSDGPGRAAVGELLGEPGQARSRSAVLRALDTRARDEPGPVLDLVGGPDAPAWLLDPSPPPLRALRAVQRLAAARRGTGPARARNARSADTDLVEFALVTDTLTPGTEPDGASVRLALRLVWAGHGPDTGGAARMLRAHPRPETAEAASALVAGAERPHRRITALADLLMDHYLDLFPPRHRPVVELVALTGRLREVGRGSGTDRVVRRHMELLLSRAGRGPLGQDAARAVVERVLDPHGFAADDRVFALEFAEFAARATPELAAAYARRARSELPPVLRGDYRMCAAHAWLWWSRGGSPAWEAERGALLDRVLAPALRALRPALRRDAFSLIGAVAPDTAEQVRSWMQDRAHGRPHGIGTLLSRVGPAPVRARTDRSARPVGSEPRPPRGPGR